MDAVLDGAAIRSREELHAHLARALSLPDWYGRNLDALYDCLTDLGVPTVLHLRNSEALEACLGSYARALETVLRDAGEENPLLTVLWEETL